MDNKKGSGFELSKRASCLAHIIFVLCMIGIFVYSLAVPKFGLSWGWIVLPMAPIWVVIMANISPR
jgi:hypothetical protein